MAVKKIDNKILKNQYNYEIIKREIEIMKRLDDPLLVKMYDNFQTDNNVYIILEFCNGGDLE